MLTVKNLIFALTLFSTVGCGLMAGVFFAFSTFVMKGLSKIPVNEGISAMQSINSSVAGSVFGATFLLTPLICFITIIFAVWRWESPGSIYILAGGVLYIISNFLVTFVFNIPLNDALAAVVPNSADGANLWNGYLDGWMFWNHVRSIGAIFSTISFILALSR